MKQFVLNRSGDTPVMEQVPTEKIKVYESTEKAELALDDLQTGEVIATKDTAYNMGLPLGSIISHEGDIIPNNFLLCDGSTFDKNKYPLLYALLGSNKTPIKYDHSSPSDLEAFTISITNQVMPYDGVLYLYETQRRVVLAYLNDVQILGLLGESNYHQSDGITIQFKAGDTIRFSDNNTFGGVCNVRYYKKPMIIKATEGGYEKSDYVFSLLTAYIDEKLGV